MNDTVDPGKSSEAPYLWAVVIIIGIGAMFFLGILALRPAIDPFVLMGEIAKPLVPTIAAVLAYMKSQETHLSVNSQLTKWKDEYARMVKAETTVSATDNERNRAAGEKVVEALATSIPAAVVAAAAVPAGTATNGRGIGDRRTDDKEPKA